MYANNSCTSQQTSANLQETSVNDRVTSVKEDGPHNWFRSSGWKVLQEHIYEREEKRIRAVNELEVLKSEIFESDCKIQDQKTLDTKLAERKAKF